jgi:hypothetical protein
MRVNFHPEFAKDIRRFEAEYAQVSEGLAARFRNEVDHTLCDSEGWFQYPNQLLCGKKIRRRKTLDNGTLS